MQGISDSEPAQLKACEPEREHVMSEWPAARPDKTSDWDTDVEVQRDWQYWLCWNCLANPSAKYKLSFEAGGNDLLLPALTSMVMRPVDRFTAIICKEGNDLLPVDRVGVASASSIQPDHTIVIGSSTDLPKATRLPGPSTVSSRDCLWSKRSLLHKSCLLIAFVVHVIWYYHHLLAATTAGGKPLLFECASHVKAYSPDDIGICGTYASRCTPSTSWMHIRCPSWCSHSQSEFENGELIRKVIGSGPYRADSGICMAARHAGHIGEMGGCIKARFGGPAVSFAGSKVQGIQTLDFDSWFPLTLDVREDESSSNCGYQQWPALLALSVVFLFLFSLLRPPKQMFFWTMVVVAYWECALISQGGHSDVEMISLRVGGFITYIPICYMLLWKIGSAATFFPDTSLGTPFNILFLEVIPCFFTLHMHLLKYVLGDYSLNLASLKSAGGVLFYCGMLLILIPIACFLFWRWYISGMLKNFCCIFFGAVLTLVAMSLYFAYEDWGLHLHHYFLGLVGYLFARGNSRPAAFARALCLGVFVNGFVIWGERLELSLWAAGEGWAPPVGSINFASSGSENVVFSAAEAMLENRSVLLSWARESDVVNNCSLPLELQPTNDVFVIEMNHVEVYRGNARSAIIPLLAGASRFYFRATILNFGFGGRDSVSKVLVVDDTSPAVTPYYLSSSNACDRVDYLRNQPESSLAKYV